jgi:uncharacterized protein with HEPN domain
MRDTATVIGEMLEAIAAAREGCAGQTVETFAAARLPRLAVERAIEIISEAARHLPEDVLARHPLIPWAKVRAVGNVLRHEYYRVAPPIIWNVVQLELGALEHVLQQELSSATFRP